ncbi:MAG: methyltransferase domain-containing protein [Bryobacteraceae bacterium]
MALLLEQTILYHPGRTGGHWVKAFVREAGLIRGESARLHDSPVDLRYWPEATSRPWSIAFVRHPLTWIRSLWIHETQFGWTNDTLRPPDEMWTFPEYLEYLIGAFPDGAVRPYFAPFIDNVNLIGRFEGLATELPRLLRQAGETVPEMPDSRRVINRSADDIVSRSAKAPRAILERFLANDSDYCGRFGYETIPKACLTDVQGFQGKWAPVLTASKDAVPQEDTLTPEHSFVFSDGTKWAGKPEHRRWQLAIWDALSRNSAGQKGGFLELGCGDGFFVFTAEELGYAPCWGVDRYLRSTPEAAAVRLHSKAQFLKVSALAQLDDRSVSTILIRGELNNTPWPHLLLLDVKRILMQGGEIIIGSVILEPDPDPGLCFSNFGDSAIFPQWCPMIMSRKYLIDMVSQCGLVVDEIYSEYDEIVSEEKRNLLEGLAKFLHCPQEGLLRRVVWRLRLAEEQVEPPELEFWLRSKPPTLVDCSPADLNQAARETIDQLTAENVHFKGEVELLRQALYDREADLQGERNEAALRNAELQDRTHRLERALSQLDNFNGEPGWSRTILSGRGAWAFLRRWVSSLRTI